MSRLNVLIFEPYPFDSEGGNQRTLSYFLEFMDREKFNLVLVSPLETNFIRKLRKQGIDCVTVSPPQRLGRYGGKVLKDTAAGKILTVMDLLPYNLNLRKVIREKKIDVIYCNCIRAVLSINMAAKLSRTPVLWYIKGELNNQVLDAIGFALSDRILFFCEQNKNDKYPGLIRLYDDKIGILRIGIDLDSVRQIENKDKSHLKKELGIKNSNTNMIYLGQLYPPKGIHYLIEAMGMLIDAFPDIMLYAVGDHVIEEYREYKKEIVRLIEKLGLEGRVVFTGWRSDAMEVASLMDILVHPSLSEGFGRAVLEGMSLGKPVVATKVGGLREIIKDGQNGFLVDPENPGQVAEKLSILLKDRDLRKKMGKAARETVFSEYMIEDKVRQFERILCDLASGG